jgi:hypothetical protein
VENKPSLSRRDFFKVAGAGLAAMVVLPKVEYLAQKLGVEKGGRERLAGTELELAVPATQVPVLGYRYPGFSEAGVEMPKDMFLAQMDLLKEGGFVTLTDTEMTKFIDSRITVPAKSVALRIDQGAEHFDEFGTMIDELKRKGFKATVFIRNEDQLSSENRSKLSGWVSEGVISLGTDKRENEPKCPVIYPFVTTEMLKVISVNGRNNPRSVNLSRGYPFDKLLFSKLTPVNLEKIETLKNDKYAEVAFAKSRYLPTDIEQTDHLTRPGGIIIHTDDQSGTNFHDWNTDVTYNTLLNKGIDTHFAVGRNGIDQFLKMYQDLATPTRGALGFRSYISIEQCGRDYDDILNPSASLEKRLAIEEISTKTINLCVRLMETYGFGLEKVLGQYAATAAGKTDPGQRYMEEYFVPQLRKAFLARRNAEPQVRPRPTN